MATYFTDDFSDFSTCSGSDCGDWTCRYNDQTDWAVSGGDLLTTGGKTLDHSALSWDDIDADADSDDVEILVKFTTAAAQTSENSLYFMLRGSGADEAPYMYVFRVGAGANNARIYKTTGSDSFSSVVSASFTWANSETYWLRMRANGTTLQAKVWLDGDSEPGTWLLDATDLSVSGAGWVGFNSYAIISPLTVHQIGVGTNGDTAPSAAAGGVTGTGDLESGASTLSGAGAVAHAGAGALESGASTVDGTGEAQGAEQGTGDLTSGPSALAGVGSLTHSGTGALDSGSSAAAGAGALTHNGTGALESTASEIAGTGALTHVGTGALDAGASTVDADGITSVPGVEQGTGDLVSGTSALAGAGTMEHKGAGSLEAGTSEAAGTGALTHRGTGALDAGASTLAGAGVWQGAIEGIGSLVSGGSGLSGTNVVVEAGGFFKRPRRRETESYRDWKRSLGKPDLSDLEEPEEAPQVVEAEPAAELPQLKLIEFPVYRGLFLVDIPKALPQEMIDLANAQAMEAAREAHLMRLRMEDEELLLMLASA